MKTRPLLATIGILWALGLLFVLWRHAQNGHYQLGDGVVLDTRTGAVYSLNDDKEPLQQIALPPR